MLNFFKKISLFLIMTLIVNNLIVINSKAETIATSNVQEFNNIVIFADFADSTDNFITSDRRTNVIDMYNGTSIKALSNYISAISNGKMKVNNYFPQDNNGVIIPYRLSKPRSYYNNSTEYEMIKEIVNNVKVDSSI